MNLAITNLREFKEELRELHSLPMQTVLEHQKAAADQAIDGTTFRTPVDTGELLGGWNVTIGNPSDAPTGRLDQVGSETRSKAKAMVHSLRNFDVIYLQNPVEHGQYIEFGLFVPADPGESKDPRPGRKGVVLVAGGRSTRAPKGMLQITADEVRLVATAKARRA